MNLRDTGKINLKINMSILKNKLKFDFTIKPRDRIDKFKQKPKLIWLTGLYASGKSTLANALDIQLFGRGFNTCVLDGDNLRTGINKDLSFSVEGRKENLRRAVEISGLFLNAGIIVIAAFVSPFAKDREMITNIIGPDNFIEIFVDTPIDVCEQRDTKGLYKKARAGEINDSTGINSPYETPVNPFIKLDAFYKFADEIIKDNLQLLLPELIL